jgi:hypothetical protein
LIAKGISEGIFPVKESMMYSLAFASRNGRLAFVWSSLETSPAIVSFCISLYSPFYRAFAHNQL